MQWVVRTQGRDFALGRVVATPGGDHVDRQGQRFVDRQSVIQVAGKIGDCGFARLGNVWTHLQVAWVARTHPVDKTRIGAGDDEFWLLRRVGISEVRQEGAHRWGELREGHHVVTHCPDVLAGQRLVVRDEQVRPAHITLGLGVVPTVNGVVRALEEQRFAVGDDFARQTFRAGNYARRCDD